MNWESATFATLVAKLTEIIDVLIYVVFAVTLIIIIWQIIKAWIIAGGNPAAVEEGKKTIIIAFIVLIVMVTVWGIIALLRAGLGLA